MSMARFAFALAVVASFVGVRSALAQGPARPPQMLHPLAGKQDCLSCHGPGANAHIVSTPATHHFANGACGMCHKPSAVAPPAMKHAADDAHAECRKCHVQAAEGAAAPAPGAAPAPPASHARIDASVCRLCHEPAASGGAGGS
jgi:hypothetical protein